jgi:hypothetical protein
MATYADLKQRYLDLVGQPTGTIDDFGKRNIAQAIKDIVNKYAFSWNLTSSALSYAQPADLPSNYNPTWHVFGAVDESNNQYYEIRPDESSNFTSSDYVYWLTYNTTTHLYQVNTLHQYTTLTVYYYFIPTPLSIDADVSLIPDDEAVSYLAASKNWIGAERDPNLTDVYEQEAAKLITAMYVRDMENQPVMAVSSLFNTMQDFVQL